MKSIFSFVFFICIFNYALFCQNIYNSSDVKLKTPLKQDWAYKADKVILNQKIVDNVCLINTLEGVLAISLKDGKELWKYSYPAKPVISSVVTFSDKQATFLTYEYVESEEKGKSKLYLIDLASGKEKWTITFDEIWFRPIALLNDQNVYIIGGIPDDWEKPEEYFEMELDEAYLYCYSIEDGKEIYKTALLNSDSNLLSLIDEKMFLTYDFDIDDHNVPQNKLLALDAKNGQQLWEFDPGSSFGEIIYFDNKFYTRPLSGFPGEIACLDPQSGEDVWSKSNGANNLYFQNNKVYAYELNATNEYGSITSWYCVDNIEGDKVFWKVLTTESKVLGSMIDSYFKNTAFGKISASVSGYANLFSSEDNPIPKIIPTSSLFTGLSNKSVLNDKGLFAIYNDDEIYLLNIMKEDPEDETKIEYNLPEGIKDLSIANGTSPASAFITYAGKVASINITSGKEEWSKEFEPNSNSLGLIIRGDNIYLFTTNSVYQLSSE